MVNKNLMDSVNLVKEAFSSKSSTTRHVFITILKIMCEPNISEDRIEKLYEHMNKIFVKDPELTKVLLENLKSIRNICLKGNKEDLDFIESTIDAKVTSDIIYFKR